MGYTNNNGWKRMKVTATGTVLGLGAGTIFGGIMCPTVGTSSTLAAYDAASADVNTIIFPATAVLTAGQFVSPTAGVVPITANAALSDGIVLNTGLHLVFGGTGSPVFWVLYK